jgi:hypothetical protein
LRWQVRDFTICLDLVVNVVEVHPGVPFGFPTVQEKVLFIVENISDER